MTHTVAMPALDGRDPLGFLAALGVLRLLSQRMDAHVALSFSDATAQAVLHSPYASCHDIAEQLMSILSAIPTGSVIPDVPPEYPTLKQGTKGADPMRPLRDDYRELHAKAAQHGEAALAWQRVLVTDLGVDSKKRAALTPYMAPAGQQTVRSFFEKTTALLRRDPNHIRDALTGWRRVDNYTGEYFDHRAVRSAADHPRGTSSEIGAPGATWLAIMALPMLRLAGDGTNVTATLWRRGPHHPPTMLWPLWRHPLDLAAVTALIEHPSIRFERTANGKQLEVNTNSWAALGIFTVAAARRRRIPDRQTAGVLVPVHVTASS